MLLARERNHRRDDTFNIKQFRITSNLWRAALGLVLTVAPAAAFSGARFGDGAGHVASHLGSSREPVPVALCDGIFKRPDKGRASRIGVLQHPQPGTHDLADIVESTTFHAFLRKPFKFGREMHVGAHFGLLYQSLI